MRSFEIAGRPIGPKSPPFIIAEVSANHGGDLARAKRIVSIAADAGADAVKFQLYTADSLTLDIDRREFRIGGDSLWRNERLHDLYSRAETPSAWFEELFAHARSNGLIAFASVFDVDGIDQMNGLGAPAYKIASFEAVDLELVSGCARTGKPLIISTGLCTKQEIHDAVDAFSAAGGEELCLLRCNSAYPADPAEANLATIQDMIETFRVPIGYSDHTMDPIQAIAAVALGACVIEKHLIDERAPATPDSEFSCLPEEFATLVDGCRRAFDARGDVAYGPTQGEQSSLVFRRSLFVVEPVAAGDPFTRQNVRSVRPGAGMAPKLLHDVLGRRATRDVAAGTPMAWDLVE